MLAVGHVAGGTTMEKKSKVLLVDDHPVLREGLTRLINDEPDLTVCGEADDVPAALRAVAKLKPDIAVVDLSLKGGDGIDLTKSIRQMDPDVPVLILTMHDEAFYAERALRAGAQGFVSKQDAGEEVLAAIRQILNGELYVSAGLSTKVIKKLLMSDGVEDRPLVERLSDRELQVFRLIGEGKGTKEIADELNLSPKTIETYRAHIKEKLNIPNAIELVRQAVQLVEQGTLDDDV